MNIWQKIQMTPLTSTLPTPLSASPAASSLLGTWSHSDGWRGGLLPPDLDHN